VSNYVLLTGATGLVGRYLVRDLLLEGRKLCLVLRASEKETIHQRVEGILQFWEQQFGRPLPRPVCFEGDVAEPSLGLNADQRRWVKRHCRHVLHNAAVLTFHGMDRQGEPWKTNLTGTQHVLALCRDLALRDLHYVSTAYVCGCRQGLIREHELDCGQTFRNDYEHSKFEAEKLVRQAEFLDELTIYRPAVISGDSRTGYTSTYHGVYFYLKLMSVLVWNREPGPDGVRYTPVRLNMTGDEPRNVVPVDWVSGVICRLFVNPRAHGRTYHLAPDRGVTPRELIEAGYKYFNSRGVEFVGSKRDQALTPMSAMDQAARENTAIYEPYDVSDPEFDTTNLRQMAADLPCPKIDQAMLHRYWRYGEGDRWGKRRVPKPEVPFCVAEYLADLKSSHGTSRFGNGRYKRHEVGLDVLGPGGGQWNLVISGHRIASIEPGIPENCPVLYQLPSCVFAQFAIGALPVRYELLRFRQWNRTLSNGDLGDAVARALFPQAVGVGEVETVEAR
jgi:thioester reductase-like protein